MNLTNMATKQQLQQKSNKFFQQVLDQPPQFTWIQGTILRGEYLNEK